jgi:CAAX protease family protein
MDAGTNLQKMMDWVRGHQIAAFFTLVFGVSWPLMALTFWGLPDSQPLQALSGKLWAFCPALIALLIAAIVEPEPKRGNGGPGRIAFAAGWLFSWLILSLNAWLVSRVTVGMGLLIAFGFCALLPAWILSSAFSCTPGIRKQFSTLLKPKGSILWYGVALCTFPLVLLAGVGITRVTGGAVAFRDLGLGSAVVFPLLFFLEGFLMSGGVNEESGWRGFALPRLQARHSVLSAALIVWFFWALWHLPYDLGSGTPVGQIIVNRLFFNLLTSILFAWAYNRSKGSVLAPALFHASMNTSGAFLPVTLFAVLLLLVVVVFVIVFDRMWRKLPADSSAVYRIC